MKFWQKIFLGTLIIFVIAFDGGVYVLAKYAYDFNLQRERSRSLSERYVIASGLSASITLRKEKTRDFAMNEELSLDAIKPYADYYRSHNIRMELYVNGNPIFSNGPAVKDQRPELTVTGATSITRRIKGRKYLYTAGPVPGYPNLTLVHIRTMEGLEAFKENFIRVFLWVSTGVCLILALAIFLLLKGLTRPIGALNMAAARISRGDYNERLLVRRQDELGELAQNFNIMAQAIQDHTQALTRAAEEKQRFVDNLAHELRTPLTAIRGYAEYLENAHCTEEERIKAAGHLSKSTARLQNLSFKLLDMTYLRTRNLQPERLNVSRLFKELSAVMEPSLKEKRITLNIVKHLEHLWGDETLLLSLLTNLVDNAIQASPTEGQITVKAYSSPNPVLEVSDQGRGMDIQEIQRVLEPFYRTDESRSRKNGGIGLGLTLCGQIAALHHAELFIDSQPEKGTIVKVIFTTSLQHPDNLIKNTD